MGVPSKCALFKNIFIIDIESELGLFTCMCPSTLTHKGMEGENARVAFITQHYVNIYFNIAFQLPGIHQPHSRKITPFL
jgi:hypothetical protein